MNSDLMNIETQRSQLWTMILVQTESLPNSFKGSLPTIEQIEAELEGDLG